MMCFPLRMVIFHSYVKLPEGNPYHPYHPNPIKSPSYPRYTKIKWIPQKKSHFWWFNAGIGPPAFSGGPATWHHPGARMMQWQCSDYTRFLHEYRNKYINNIKISIKLQKIYKYIITELHVVLSKYKYKSTNQTINANILW